MGDSTGQTVTTSQLLETKLFMPRWRPSLLSRRRLIERLDQGDGRKLILISAPAGFGKTTLLAEWLTSSEASERPTAWVSLDESDNDPTLFWSYVIRALQNIRPEVGIRALSSLQSPQPAPIESVLTALINEINSIEHDFTLVLDDFHVIDGKPVHDAIAFLIEHLPPQMRLIITSRADPPLALGRLRGRGELIELRAADLRFTSEEAAAFLNEVMGLRLTLGDVEALETRIEGWIAGLQLAALSMQGREDISGFIKSFAGDDRYIVDYLVEEVLQRQPERVRSFLLQTSILDRLSDSLCNSITDMEDAEGMLGTLERSNLFVVPLDDKRKWYRYHHLFADVLRAHAKEEQPEKVSDRHRRASDWFEDNGLRADAVRHALAAEDFERAADLIELAWPAMDGNYQFATWLGWAKALPEALVPTRPVLSVGYAWALLDGGEFDGAEPRLRDAERWLDVTLDTGDRPDGSAPQMVVVDHEQFGTLPASISSARAYMALAFGDVPGTVKHARQALDFLPDDAHSKRGVAASILGLAYWATGDLEAAYQSLAEGMDCFRLDGNIVFAISGTYGLADIRKAQGRLRDAVSLYEQSLQLALAQGEPAIRGTGDLYLGLGELHHERGDQKSAMKNLLKSEELGEQVALPDWPYRNCIAKALVKQAAGDLDGALDLLDEAERLYVRAPVPAVRPISAMKARVWTTQGRFAEALDWARDQDLSIDDVPSYLHEYELLTLARALVAQCKREREDRSINEAVDLLERLLRVAEEEGRTGSVIDILIQQSLAHEAQDKILPALASLERALTLAEPEGYLRIFVDEGEPMRVLLRQATAKGISSSYTRRLLSAFGEPPTSISAARGKVNDLSEPLTAREVEILRLVAAGMRNQEIADQLFISLATVKRHIANAYGKLGASHRMEAVARANELNLL